ncbi:MAG: precorrin-6A/cobalt-precorrin-6A reductase [Tissierellia bacterium]|nr:precorrin-6A/cobalt-precorrin-6A reductase [Tissierellia bacterium]
MKWIIGGTAEAREFVNMIKDSKDYILSVATEAGVKFAGTKKLYVGRLSKYDMIDFIKENNINQIFDLSHPFAHIVSDNAKFAANETAIEYYRYKREETKLPEGGILAKDLDEALKIIGDLKGTILFTTGSKNIPDFQKVRGDNRFIFRVLPTSESMKICEENNLELRDIIAALGPFSRDFDKVLMTELKTDYCVMKDSGKGSGTFEKLEACKQTKTVPIIIMRRKEEGISDLKEIYKIFMGEK